MSVDKLFNIISGVEYQLNILKDAIKVLDKEEQGKVDEAYRRGYDDATKMIASDEQSIADKTYQQGLEDAWEAARNISMLESDGGYSWKEMKRIFGTDSASEIYVHHTATEAINKIKAYEEKQNDEIEVGDEVKHIIGECKWTAVVTRIDDGVLTLMGESGAIADDYSEENFVKTGRHFDISKILEEMKK